MYLEEINDENLGPIDQLKIKMNFDEKNNPKPLILVGKNGAGKSIVLSNIVDSLYEFAEQAYNDITKKNEVGGHDYFKIISSNQIKLGKNYSYSYLKFKGEKNNYEYLLKQGDIEYKKIKEKHSNIKLSYKNEDVFLKITTSDKSNFKTEFANGTYCYFSPNRYARPVWLNKEYTKEEIDISEKFESLLNKPITVRNMENDNKSWLLDIIVDSRPDVIKNANSEYAMRGITNQQLDLLSVSRKNVEEILSEILEDEVYLSLNFRSFRGSRFNIKDKTGKMIIPTLDSLSTGQAALFNIFTTIIRYADMGDINKSIHISDIEGIVVIDEIELHLHSVLQKEILPKLIKKFPKVQFIITSHSPLFLLGMEEQFGKDGFDIYNLPSGEKIGTESFSEFKKSYNYMQDTTTYKEELKAKIDEKTKTKPLIVTEGCTDWRHMKRALKKLKVDPKYAKDFKDLEVEFLMYDDTNIKDSEFITFGMGYPRIKEMCEYYSRTKQNNKIIFIGDRDIADEKILSEENKKFKEWGNNVYSFQIPVPTHREDTPNICIEHYYTDEEIKTEYICEDGIARRMFLGNEFNSKGINTTKGKICKNLNKCGNNKIDIIEGSSKDRVMNFDDNDETNYALSKRIFADNIYEEKGDFSKLSYESFKDIFYIVKEILGK